MISPENARKNFTRDQPFTWMLKNLDIFKEQVAKAATQLDVKLT